MTKNSPTLVVPGKQYLAGFAAALAQGWSPDGSRDLSAQMLAEIAADADRFIARLASEGAYKLENTSPRSGPPVILRWIWDGEFCGSINLRWLAGTDKPPKHVSGHIGYAVVPWKRHRGYATAALLLILNEAREVGLRRVEITADADNHASHRVIENAGGVFETTRPPDTLNPRTKHVYFIDLAK